MLFFCNSHGHPKCCEVGGADALPGELDGVKVSLLRSFGWFCACFKPTHNFVNTFFLASRGVFLAKKPSLMSNHAIWV